MFRIVEITTLGASLRIRDKLLQIHQYEEAAEFSIPLEELSAVLITEPGIQLTGYVLAELADKDIPLICCNKQFMPTGVLTGVALTGKTADVLLASQFYISKPLKKQLWQKITIAKIYGQAHILKKWRNTGILYPLAKKVRSDDAMNLEAQAAAIYWKILNIFPKRQRDAANANRLLNYGYIILYAAFAREIALAGLLPRIGLHHHHRNNAFCLASDLMEPYRFIVDEIGLNLLEENPEAEQLKRQTKYAIMQKLYAQELKGGSLFQMIRQTVQSYKQCLLKKDAELLILPELR